MAQRRSKLDTVLAFAGSGALAGVLLTSVWINAQVWLAAGAPITVLAVVLLVGNVLWTVVVGVVVGFLPAQIAAVPTGLVFALLPRRLQSVGAAALIGSAITASTFGVVGQYLFEVGLWEFACIGGAAAAIAAFLDNRALTRGLSEREQN